MQKPKRAGNATAAVRFNMAEAASKQTAKSTYPPWIHLCNLEVSLPLHRKLVWYALVACARAQGTPLPGPRPIGAQLAVALSPLLDQAFPIFSRARVSEELVCIVLDARAFPSFPSLGRLAAIAGGN